MLLSVKRVLVFSILVTCSVCVHVPFDLTGWKPVSLTDKNVSDSMSVAAKHIGGKLIKPITAFKWIENVPSWDLYRLSFRGIFMKKEEYECHADVVWISNHPSGVTVFNVGCVPLSYINKHLSTSYSGKASDYMTPVTSKPTHKQPTYDKPTYKSSSTTKQNVKEPTKYIPSNNNPGIDTNTINKLSYRSAKQYSKENGKTNPIIKTTYKSVDTKPAYDKTAVSKESPIKYLAVNAESGKKVQAKNDSPINYLPVEKMMHKATDTKGANDKATVNKDSPIKYAAPSKETKTTSVKKTAGNNGSPTKYASQAKPTYKSADTKSSTNYEKPAIKDYPVNYAPELKPTYQSTDTKTSSNYKSSGNKESPIKYASAIKQTQASTDTKSSTNYEPPAIKDSPVKYAPAVKSKYQSIDTKSSAKYPSVKYNPAIKPSYPLNETKSSTNSKEPTIKDSPVNYAPVIKSTYKSIDTKSPIGNYGSKTKHVSTVKSTYSIKSSTSNQNSAVKDSPVNYAPVVKSTYQSADAKNSTDYKKSGKTGSPIKYVPAAKSSYTPLDTKSNANDKNPSVKDSPVNYATAVKSKYKSADTKNTKDYKTSGNNGAPVKYVPAAKSSYTQTETKTLTNDKNLAINDSPVSYSSATKSSYKSTDTKPGYKTQINKETPTNYVPAVKSTYPSTGTNAAPVNKNSPINYAPVIKSKTYDSTQAKVLQITSVNYAPVVKSSYNIGPNSALDNNNINNNNKIAYPESPISYVKSVKSTNKEPGVKTTTYDKTGSKDSVKTAKYQSSTATKNSYNLAPKFKKESYKPIQTKAKTTYKKLDSSKSTYRSLPTKAPAYDDALFKAELIYKLFGLDIPSETASPQVKKYVTPFPTVAPPAPSYQPKYVPNAKIFPPSYKGPAPTKEKTSTKGY